MAGTELDGADLDGADLDATVFTPVSPRLTAVKLTASALGHLVGLALLSVPLVLRTLGVWPGVGAWIAWGLPALVFVSFLVDLVLVPRRVRAMGWAERADDVLWRHGLLVRRVDAVPYGRLQYVDTSDGPLLRRHGLRTLTLRTAASEGRLELQGLPVETCERLREVLLARGQARLAGL